MKRKGKVAIAVIVLMILLILLIPIPIRYRDGGSVRYRAVLYDVKKYHQLDLESETGYNDGWKIKVIGIPIYDDFKQ